MIDHVTFRHIEHPDAYDQYDHLPGTGVFVDNGGITVQDSVFQNMGRMGLLAAEPTPTPLSPATPTRAKVQRTGWTMPCG